MHREGLAAELRMVRDDVHRLQLELTERAQRVTVLEAKFAVLVGRHGSGEDGEEKSQVRENIYR